MDGQNGQKNAKEKHIVCWGSGRPDERKCP